MDRMIEFTTSSYTVARIQRYFGVETDIDLDRETESESCMAKKENGGIQAVKDSNYNGVIDSAVNQRASKGQRRYNLRSRSKQNDSELRVENLDMTAAETLNSEEDLKENTPLKLNCGNTAQPLLGNVKYKVKSKLWFYLFHLGGMIGNELFLSMFLPWCWWNMSEWVTRRVIIVFAVVMYIGQSSKDVFKLPRPSSPPVAKLESLYGKEHGMPSTHAMMAVCIPGTMLFFTMQRYQFPLGAAVAIMCLTYFLTCGSRFYLGMHNVSDVIVGTIAAVTITLLVLPYANIIDEFLSHHEYGLITSLVVGITMTVIYPTLDLWSDARYISTLVAGVGSGTFIGKWVGVHYALLPSTDPTGPLLLEITPPDLSWFVFMLLRTAIGVVVILATKSVMKPVMYYLVAFVLGMPLDEARSTEQVVVEMPRVFFTYIAIAVNAVLLIPIIHHFCGIAMFT